MRNAKIEATEFGENRGLTPISTLHSTAAAKKRSEANEQGNWSWPSKGVNEGVNTLLALIIRQPGLRVPVLASTLGTSPKNVQRWLQRLKAAGRIEFRGAPKQVEHEVAALRALKMLALPDNADEYTLVTTLRITKAKARNLLNEDAMRPLY